MILAVLLLYLLMYMFLIVGMLLPVILCTINRGLNNPLQSLPVCGRTVFTPHRNIWRKDVRTAVPRPGCLNLLRMYRRGQAFIIKLMELVYQVKSLLNYHKVFEAGETLMRVDTIVIFPFILFFHFILFNISYDQSTTWLSELVLLCNGHSGMTLLRVFGTGIMLADLKHSGTLFGRLRCWKCLSIPLQAGMQSFRTQLGMLYKPADLHGLTLRNYLLTSSVVTLGGCSSGGKGSLVFGAVLLVSKWVQKWFRASGRERASIVSVVVICDCPVDCGDHPHALGVIGGEMTLYC